jgi:hypothetical protein
VLIPPDCGGRAARFAESDAGRSQVPSCAAALEPALNRSAIPCCHAATAASLPKTDSLFSALAPQYCQDLVNGLGSRRPVSRQDPAMTSLNETLLTAAGLFGRGTSAASAGTAEPRAFPDFSADDAPLAEGRDSSPEGAEADDPFFTAVADALREAGYLDS